MYCAWRISALLRCDVVGPGLVSTSPAFVRSSASHPSGQHDRLAQKKLMKAVSIV